MNAFISYSYAHDGRTNVKKNRRRTKKTTRKDNKETSLVTDIDMWTV